MKPMHPTAHRLLDAAEELFAEHGFRGTSVRAILRKAGYEGQIALMQHHFGKKIDLYEAVWERVFRNVDTPEEQEIDSGLNGPIGQSLRKSLLDFLAPPARLGHSERGQFFLSIMRQELADPARDERGLVKRFLEPPAVLLSERLAIELPRLSAVQRDFAVQIVLTTAQSMMSDIHEYRGQGRLDIDESLEMATEILASGLEQFAGEDDR